MQPVLRLASPCLQFPGVVIENPNTISIPRGMTVLVGPNGAGKSMLATIIRKGANFGSNRIESEEPLRIESIEFRDIHSLSGLKTEYYQQRYEATMNDEVPTVAEVFYDAIITDGWSDLCQRFGFTPDAMLRHINYLSSGELRKMLIINKLVRNPDLLIIDYPFIGLDDEARSVLMDMLRQLTAEGQSTMLLVSDVDEIPDFATAVVPIHDMRVDEPIDVQQEGIENVRNSLRILFDYAINVDTLQELLGGEAVEPGREVVRLRQCQVRAGNRILVDNLDWQILSGQCWHLRGANGSGKSTLLSIICGDNPQAYCNDVTIFGLRRGSGESIWDVKRHIGFLSTELHLYFHGGSNRVADVVARGMNDYTAGATSPISVTDKYLAKKWIDLMHLRALSDRPFASLSTGEQQMVLLARTFVRVPELLILDEPLHGLDLMRRRAMRAIINTFVRHHGTTVIYVNHNDADMLESVNHTISLDDGRASTSTKR